MAKTAVAKRKKAQLNLFDYGDLASADVKQCEEAVERITGYQRRMASDVVYIGLLLEDVKDRLPHGQFGGWIKHYFGWSQQTASNMMRAAETFGKLPNFGDLTIDMSAVYLLASNKCPDELREEVLERAEKGERITHATVRDALDDLVDDDDEPDDTDPPPDEEPESVDDEDVIAEAYDDADGGAYDDVVAWSLGEFVAAMHRAVGHWRSRCPADQLEEMAEVLRDMAEQIEETQRNP